MNDEHGCRPLIDIFDRVPFFPFVHVVLREVESATHVVVREVLFVGC